MASVMALCLLKGERQKMSEIVKEKEKEKNKHLVTKSLLPVTLTALMGTVLTIQKTYTEERRKVCCSCVTGSTLKSKDQCEPTVNTADYIKLIVSSLVH